MRRKLRCGGKAVSAIVLAGGRSQRMGADKAGLAIGRRTLLERVLAQIGPHFDEILVSVSPGQRVSRFAGAVSKRGAEKKGTPSRQSGQPGSVPVLSGPRIVVDEFPRSGPLAGILAGLKAAANDACAVLACDIPDIHVAVLRKLVRAAEAADIVVPLTPAGQFEPLFAVYKKSVIFTIETLLRSGERSVLPLFDLCRTIRLPLEDASWLRNLNTPAEYRDYLKSVMK